MRRRYNDFVWLRDMLVASYPGMFIPALPAANKVNFSSKSVGGSKVNSYSLLTRLCIQRFSLSHYR